MDPTNVEDDLVPFSAELASDGPPGRPNVPAAGEVIQSPSGGTESASLRPEAVLRPGSSFWGRSSGALRRLAGKALVVDSRDGCRTAELMALVRRPLVDPWTVAFVSLKGGVGRTTACAAVGSILASERDDLVVAVDCNADGGDLAHRIVDDDARFTISDLLAARLVVDGGADVRKYTLQARSRLEVLAANRDPRAAYALDGASYWHARALLYPRFGVILLDCGGGLLSEASTAAVLMADQLVIVASASLDAARASFRTVEWLENGGLERKVRQAAVAINASEAHRRVRVDAIESAFRKRCRSVVRIPSDPHLRSGAQVDLDALRPGTRDAYLRLAAAAMNGNQT